MPDLYQVQLGTLTRGDSFWNVSALGGGTSRWTVLGPGKRYGYVRCVSDEDTRPSEWPGAMLVRTRPHQRSA